ncbi:MAG: helix-turn-helix transcriptional regulator [Deltaproteobacteria bacterium]|nr:helix-turn-helix transcriptional regulator [Deltaproteobacteria bacterium]
MYNYAKIKKEVIKISTENAVKEIRERLMMSKSELARKAGISLLTVVRIEKGNRCRIGTKRKIVEALGFNPWLNEKTAISPTTGVHGAILHKQSSLKPDHDHRRP